MGYQFMEPEECIDIIITLEVKDNRKSPEFLILNNKIPSTVKNVAHEEDCERKVVL